MNNVIEWFARNRIGADLLMMFIMVAGFFSVSNMRSEIIPSVSLDQIAISVAYPGASPETVEKVIVNPIEAAIYDIEGIKSVSSRAVEHYGVITAEIGWGYDIKSVLSNIKARVDAIGSFPQDVQKPVIQELSIRNLVAYVMVSGNADESSLRTLATQIKTDLLTDPNISLVELTGARDYQIAVEVSESTLQRYNMTFAEVAQAIKQNTMDAPGGVVKTAQGDVALQVRGQIYDTEQLEDIVIRAMPDGGRITVGDVAKINDGFKEGGRAEFNGQPAVALGVYRVGKQSIVDISKALHEYVAHPTSYIPEGIKLTVWQDTTAYYNSRMDFLTSDALQGGTAVFLILLLFLRSEVAFWINMAVPTCFLGATIFMLLFDISYNMISLFAFILVLGIVVDEAIVIGENIFQHRRMGKSSVDAAIDGTQELFYPMLFSVLTTCCAFIPLMLLPGPEGKLMAGIPIVVVCTLAISVLEASCILPSHLAHAKDDVYDTIPVLGTIQRNISDAFDYVLEYKYRPFLEVCLRWRYTVLISFICALLLGFSLIAFGWLKVMMFSEIEGDTASATIKFADNTTHKVSDAGIKKLTDAALEIQKTHLNPDGTPQILSVYTSFAADGAGTVVLEFEASEKRTFSGEQITAAWRKAVGDVPDMTSLDFVSSMAATGSVIDIELSSNSSEDLRQASHALKSRLAEFGGLYEIRDSFQSGKQELVIQLKPTARNMGVSLDQVAYQVRQAYNGIDVQRFSRPGGDVTVVLRYPDDERGSLWNLENMNIRMSNGRSVPLVTIADIEYGEGASEIKHHQRQRVVRVFARVDDNATSVAKVMAPLKRDFLNRLSEDYPGMHWGVAGALKDREAFMSFLGQAYGMALVGMYVLMAFQFRSYLQPIMVMIVIPFGLIGSMLGHLIVGMEITIWSLVGMVAVSGVVVNDNLILIEYINDARRDGVPLAQAIRNAGVKRFRAVFLVSASTMVGVLPMITEKSLQAQFMIPMAVSVGFGTMFSSTLSLILVPSLYQITEDINGFFRRIFGVGQGAHVGHDGLVLAGANGANTDAWVEPVSIAATLDKTFTHNSEDESEKMQWHVGLDEAYEIGHKAALRGAPKRSPFDLEVLVASWEAGWDDGHEELQNQGNDTI
ncbi:Acriflavin resistance protein [gamma proteobacterium HdN1]|nr:Acriflavin resistance protein [gamma proteobacterium HdN1]